jgi:outer membrane protein assembly factor BamD (BamD/ComL family)
VEAKSDRASANAREESQLVGSARSMLRAGNATVALQLLELATARFPAGILIQEREALRIEALTALGRTSEARARAESFVKAYPKSPHVSRVTTRK